MRKKPFAFVKGLHKIFDKNSSNEFVLNNTNDNIDNNTIVLIVADNEDSTIFGQKFQANTQWIWAQGKLFSTNDASKLYFDDTTPIDGDFSNSDSLETFIKKSKKKISSKADKKDIPNVPQWALAEQKPTYTADEVGASQDGHTHSVSDITDLISSSTTFVDEKYMGLPTSQLSNPKVGQIYIDTTENTIMWWNGSEWEDTSCKAEIISAMEELIKEYIGDDDKPLDGANIKDISLVLNPTDYKFHVTITDTNDETYTSNVVDFPIESMVVNGQYDATDKKIVLSLKNDSSIAFSVADLVNGLTTEQDVSTIANDAIDYYISTHPNDLGSVNNVSVLSASGNGNVITSISASLSADKHTIKLTPTKGITAITDISGKSEKTHTHKVKINGTEKTITASDSTTIVDLGNYITKHQDISGKADKATTLSGYGITDAKIENGVITLGNNTITPLTTHQNISGKLNVSGDNGTSSGVSALLNKLSEGTSVPKAEDYYIAQYVGGGTTNTNYYRRPVSKLAEYVASTITKSTVGLANVDNTSDTSKRNAFGVIVNGKNLGNGSENQAKRWYRVGYFKITASGYVNRKIILCTYESIQMGYANIIEFHHRQTNNTSYGSSYSTRTLLATRPDMAKVREYTNDNNEYMVEIWAQSPYKGSDYKGVNTIILHQGTGDSQSVNQSIVFTMTNDMLSENVPSETNDKIYTSNCLIGSAEKATKLTINEWEGNGERDILWCGSSGENVYHTPGITINPSTKTLTATTFNGSATKVNVKTNVDSSASFNVPWMNSGEVYTTSGFHWTPSTKTLSATNFNGTASNASKAANLYTCSVMKSGANSYPYNLILSSPIYNGSYTDAGGVYMVHSSFHSGLFGIFRIILRTNNVSATSGNEAQIHLQWIIRQTDGTKWGIKAGLKKTKGNSYVDVYYVSDSTYMGAVITKLESSHRGVPSEGDFTMVNASENSTTHSNCYSSLGTTGAYRAYDEIVNCTDSTLVAASSTCMGNSSTASKLATARTLWGRSFDGSANVSGDIIGATGGINMEYTNEINCYNGALYLNHRGTSKAGYNEQHTSDIYALANGGNFGIGTTNPVNKLHVNGNGRFNGYIDFLGIDSSTRIGYIGKASSNNNIYLNSDANNVLLQTTQGNVGIGITTPNAKLQVNSSDYNVINVKRTTADSGAFIKFIPNNQETRYCVVGADSTKDSSSVAYPSFCFYSGIRNNNADSNTEKMRLTYDGKLGIGTTSPSEKLAVNGSINIGSVASDSRNWLKIGGITRMSNYVSDLNSTVIRGAKIAFDNVDGSKTLTSIDASGNVTPMGALRVTSQTGTWLGGTSDAAIQVQSSSYSAWICGKSKNGRFSISTYPNGDDYLHFGYVPNKNSDGTTYTTNGFSSEVKIDSSGNLVASGNIYGTKLFASSATTSDDRLKTYQGEYSISLNDIKNIPLRYYTLNSDKEQEIQIGTSAQSLKEIVPQLVSTDKDDMYAVDYSRLSIVSLSAIKQLVDENDNLKDKCAKLEERLSKIEEMLKLK